LCFFVFLSKWHHTFFGMAVVDFSKPLKSRPDEVLYRQRSRWLTLFSDERWPVWPGKKHLLGGCPQSHLSLYLRILTNLAFPSTQVVFQACLLVYYFTVTVEWTCSMVGRSFSSTFLSGKSLAASETQNNRRYLLITTRTETSGSLDFFCRASGECKGCICSYISVNMAQETGVALNKSVLRWRMLSALAWYL